MVILMAVVSLVDTIVHERRSLVLRGRLLLGAKYGYDALGPCKAIVQASILLPPLSVLLMLVIRAASLIDAWQV